SLAGDQQPCHPLEAAEPELRADRRWPYARRLRLDLRVGGRGPEGRVVRPREGVAGTGDVQQRADPDRPMDLHRAVPHQFETRDEGPWADRGRLEIGRAHV